MIEEDIQTLNREVRELQDQIDLIGRFLGSENKEDFCEWGVKAQSVIDSGYPSKNEARNWVDSQKTKKGDRFKKGTTLYDYRVEDVKVFRYIKDL